MKTILSIGHAHFVLPASANVNAIIAVLNKAVQVKSTYSRSGTFYTPADDTERSCAQVKIEMVADEQVIDPKSTKQKALPEKASPDAHNTFGS